MNTERWVLFDLDGTLFDYASSETAAVSATLVEAGIEPTDAVLADYRRVNAAHWVALERGETTAERLRVERWVEVLAGRAAAIGDSAADLGSIDVEALARCYLGHLAAGTHLVDGAEQVVAELRVAHRIAYVTNGLADVQRPRLEASPLVEPDDVIVISDEVGAAKPDEAIFRAAFERMGGPDRARVTMVGDSLTADIAGGAAFGLDTVWFAPARTPPRRPGDPVPTHRITDLRALPTLLMAGAGSRGSG